MALCFVPSHAVRRHCNRMSIKSWLSSFPTHCQPNFSPSSEIPSSLQVIRCVFFLLCVWWDGRGGRLFLLLIIIISRWDHATENQEQQPGDSGVKEEGGEEKEQSRGNGILQCKTSVAAKKMFFAPLVWQEEHNVQAEWCTEKKILPKTDLQIETKWSWQADLLWTFMRA